MAVPGLSQRVWSSVFARTAPICERSRRAGEPAGLGTVTGKATHPSRFFIAGLARSGSTIPAGGVELAADRDQLALTATIGGLGSPHWWKLAEIHACRLPQKLPEERERTVTGFWSIRTVLKAFEEPFLDALFFRTGINPTSIKCWMPLPTITPPRFGALLSGAVAQAAGDSPGQSLCVQGQLQSRPAGLISSACFRMPVLSCRCAIRLPMVASLLKQDRLFSAAAAQHPSVSRYLARSGHFEFGPQRRAECQGDPATGVAIQKDFVQRQHWFPALPGSGLHSYGWLARQLAEQPGLGKATLVVRYEDLCGEPAQWLARLGEHCGLEPALTDQLVSDWAPRLSLPDYYQSGLSDADQATIHRHCDEIAAGFGY